MREGQASVTALGAAGHRAAHQVLERGFVFADPLALAILGPDAEGAVALARERPERRPLRLFIAMRSRFAEDSRGPGDRERRAANPGAGRRSRHLRLPTRTDPGDARLRARPSGDPGRKETPARRGANRRAGTCRLCRSRFRAWEHDRARSTAAGLDPKIRTFVIWLGVTPYLTAEAVYATLGELARWPGGAEVVFDYANPPDRIKEAATRIYHEQMAERVAASGEPFRCYFDTAALHTAARAPRIYGDRRPRSSGAGSALSSGFACRSPAGAGRARCQDGDGVKQTAIWRAASSLNDMFVVC